MHTVNRSLLVSELPPLRLDTYSVSEMEELQTGRLVGVEEVVEIGKFYELLTLEAARGLSQAAMPAGFLKEHGFQVGTLLAYSESDKKWFDLEALLASAVKES